MPMRRTKTGIALVAGSLIGATLLLAPMATADESQGTQPAPTDIPDGYYDSADGLSGDVLKAALHDIIDGNDQISYDDVKAALADTDQDPDNPDNIITLYSGTSEPATSDAWNKEHVWAKSHGDFGTAIGPGTDLHHLRPSIVNVNSTRSNLDFDNGGEEVDGAPGNFYDSDSFEPRDADKGDVARMILYMAVRYEGDDGYPDLEPNDEVDNGKAPFIGKLSVLKEWSEQDPPSEFEMHRNDVIYEQYQHNRNPFIDHPEWVASIWS